MLVCVYVCQAARSLRSFACSSPNSEPAAPLVQPAPVLDARDALTSPLRSLGVQRTHSLLLHRARLDGYDSMRGYERVAPPLHPADVSLGAKSLKAASLPEASHLHVRASALSEQAAIDPVPVRRVLPFTTPSAGQPLEGKFEGQLAGAAPRREGFTLYNDDAATVPPTPAAPHGRVPETQQNPAPMRRSASASLPCPFASLGCSVTFSHLQKQIDHANEHKDTIDPDVWSAIVCQARLDASWGACGLLFPNTAHGRSKHLDVCTRCREEVAVVVRRERDGNESALTGAMAGITTQSLSVSVHDRSVTVGSLRFTTRDCGWTAGAHTNVCFYLSCVDGKKSEALKLKQLLARTAMIFAEERRHDIIRLLPRAGLLRAALQGRRVGVPCLCPPGGPHLRGGHSRISDQGNSVLSAGQARGPRHIHPLRARALSAAGWAVSNVRSALQRRRAGGFPAPRGRPRPLPPPFHCRSCGPPSLGLNFYL
jgi:hypothetical protein